MGPIITCGRIVRTQTSDGRILLSPEVKLGDYRLFILDSVSQLCLDDDKGHLHVDVIFTVEGAWFPINFLQLGLIPRPSRIKVYERWHPVLVETNPDLSNDGTP